MKKSLVALAIVTVLVGGMGFGLMIGVTYGIFGGSAISIGKELRPNTFAYVGVSIFPIGVEVGGGTKLGNIYATDLGTTTENKKIGKFEINYGAVASGSAEFFGEYSAFGAFVGPALFMGFESQLPGLKGKIISYIAPGVAFKFGTYNHSIEPDWTSGFFYYF